jgi:hypothetical protein
LIDPNHAASSVVYDITPQNDSLGGYVVVTNGTVYDTVAMVIAKGTGAVNNVFMEVFKENEDQSLTRISSDNISSFFTSAIEVIFVEKTLPSQAVEPGDRYVVRFRNYSSVATSIGPAVIKQTSWADPLGFRTVGTTDSGRTSLTSGQALTARTADNLVPWVMLAATSFESGDRTFMDDGSKSISGTWLQNNNTGFNFKTLHGGFVFDGTTNGSEVGVWYSRTTGDSQKSSVVVSGAPSATTHAEAGPMIHCKSDMTQTVWLGVTDNAAKIYSGAWNSLTQRASIASGGNGTWELYYDVALNKYVALKDGSTVGLDWTDTGNLMLHGRDYRYGGQRHSRVSGVNSPILDNWTLSDFTP